MFSKGDSPPKNAEMNVRSTLNRRWIADRVGWAAQATLSKIVAEIDETRQQSNLSSAIRVFVRTGCARRSGRQGQARAFEGQAFAEYSSDSCVRI